MFINMISYKILLTYSPNRGRHYRALENIKKDELIITDVGDSIKAPWPYHEHTMLPLVKKVISNPKYQALHYDDYHAKCTSPDPNISDTQWQKAINIIYTNSFYNGIVNVIYPLISYLNHSCLPNAYIDFNDNNMACIYAFKDITIGEEVCISYIGDDPSFNYRANRQNRLHYWRFICECTGCTTGSGYIIYKKESCMSTNMIMLCVYLFILLTLIFYKLLK